MPGVEVEPAMELLGAQVDPVEVVQLVILGQVGLGVRAVQEPQTLEVGEAEDQVMPVTGLRGQEWVVPEVLV
jgi:hypothetical protein